MPELRDSRTQIIEAAAIFQRAPPGADRDAVVFAHGRDVASCVVRLAALGKLIELTGEVNWEPLSSRR